jgi:hypothetical protein
VQEVRPDIEACTAAKANAESEEALRARVDGELGIGTDQQSQDLPSSPPESCSPPRPNEKHPRTFAPSSQPSLTDSSPPYRNATPEEEQQAENLLSEDEWRRQMNAGVGSRGTDYGISQIRVSR